MTEIINSNTFGLEKKRQEDPTVLKAIDKTIKKRRLNVVKVPEPESPVVVVHSGGMDSTTNIAILLEEFNLKVYPVFINRNQTNLKYEREAVNYFDDYFSKKYPKLFNKSIEVKLSTPALEYKDLLRGTKSLEDGLESRKRISYPARNPIIILTAAEYAYSLQSKGIFAKTVFISCMKEDPPRHSTLTSMRILNLLICQIMGDYSWQVICLPIEREYNNFYGKDVYLKWAIKHNLPIEKTRSCYKDQEKHCGKCYPACVNRKEAFKKAGIEDKTEYDLNN